MNKVREYVGPFNRRFDTYAGKDVQIQTWPGYTSDNHIEVTQELECVAKQKAPENFPNDNQYAINHPNPWIYDRRYHADTWSIGNRMLSHGDECLINSEMDLSTKALYMSPILPALYETQFFPDNCKNSVKIDTREMATLFPFLVDFQEASNYTHTESNEGANQYYNLDGALTEYHDPAGEGDVQYILTWDNGRILYSLRDDDSVYNSTPMDLIMPDNEEYGGLLFGPFEEDGFDVEGEQYLPLTWMQEDDQFLYRCPAGTEFKFNLLTERPAGVANEFDKHVIEIDGVMVSNHERQHLKDFL